MVKSPTRPSAPACQCRPIARPSRIVLRLVQRARWLWLHWLEQRWARFQQWRAQRRAAKAQRAARPDFSVRPDRLQLETLEPKLLLSADLIPAAGAPAPVQALDVTALAAPVDMQLRAYDWSSHALLSGVTVTPAGGSAAASDANGSLTLPGLANDSTALTVARAIPAGETTATTQAVNLQDAISILRLIVGLDVNAGGRALSPYQAIAADFDANGSVQLGDAIGVLRNVVGLSGDAPRWTFVDEADTALPGRTGLNPGLFDNTVTVRSEAQGGLVGVLRGDVDGSWAAPGGTPTLGSDYFNALVTKVNEREGANVLSGDAWRVTPSLLRLNLDPATDTETLGDFMTSVAQVNLVGRTQANVQLTLRLGNSTVAQATADANGVFTLTGVPLAEGANAFTLTLGSGSLTSTHAVNLQRGGASASPPSLSAALRTDSGALATDRITNDATISGQAQGVHTVIGLLAALDPADTNATLTDVGDLLQVGGAFSISAARMAQLAGSAGGTLADGAHTLRLVAVDSEGQRSTPFELVFMLDTVAPTGATIALASADALDSDGSQTAATVATLRGTAEAGAVISLSNGGASTVASQRASFQLPGVAFAEGNNTVTIQVTDAAGNTQSVSRVFTRVTSSQTDAVLTWNDLALRAIQLDVTDPPVATRTLALVSLAQYDTLATIEGTPAYLVQRSVGGAVNAQAAVATAAHRILSLTYPAQKAVFDTALATSLASIAEGAAKDAGITLGLSVADAVLAIRANDGSSAFEDYSGSTAVGQWRPTGPIFDVAENPHWGRVTPFALSSPSEFRPDAPPAVDTAAYAQDLNEIKALGSAASTTRTADQTQQAHFWADGKGSTTPPGHWNQIASQVALARGNSLSANARLFAQLNVALADAAIACWDAKYFYGAWRPETAIQNAELDNNAATTDDDTWRSLLITPPHPDYVSGHSTFSAAASAVLANTFGNNTAFTTSSATLPGVTRSFTSFSQAADEAGRSRVYGGIHFEYANQAGKALGQAVARAVLEKFALTQDTQAPTVAINASPAATNTNLTLTGQVLDNLSGVAQASYRIDGGAEQALSLNASGSFSITTSLATDGTADGTHTVTITATDAAGNVGAATSRNFTLDTKAPTISLSSLAEGDTLAAGSRITGTANPNGGTLTQLSYTVDGGPTQTLIFDASAGSFDAALNFGSLTVGDHTIALTAKDAAGNTATLNRAVKVDALAPFTLASITPGNGSSDVGVTQRPIVTFSRAVNTATLNANSLYATGPDGTKLAATIVPSTDGTFAWMFFTSPMPGASRITITVDGSKIRAAADGAFLDADGNGTAGGQSQVSFTTVSTTVVSGTTLKGKVVDPGADLEPMTFDDIRRGPDGVIHTEDDLFLNPIAGAKVWILGQEQNVVYTDANGNFTLNNVPTGNGKVAIDGRTATNAPTGVFWPEMVMDATMRPGTLNTLMSSMGSREEQAANIGRPEVYLPRIAPSVLQAVSGTETTVITIEDAKAAPALTQQEREALTLTVKPGSAIGEDGKPVQNAQIGIATVPPELVRDMLPPGVLQHTFDITIQAPGVAAFAEPVQITFPNVFNAAPGTKLNVLSFDHATGRLVINGTGTVSTNGSTVVSDPHSGVKAPGWHGLTPPGGPSVGPGEGPEAPAEPPAPDGDCNKEIERIAREIQLAQSKYAALAIGDAFSVQDGVDKAKSAWDGLVQFATAINQFIAARESADSLGQIYAAFNGVSSAISTGANAILIWLDTFSVPNRADLIDTLMKTLEREICLFSKSVDELKAACANDPTADLSALAALESNFNKLKALYFIGTWTIDIYNQTYNWKENFKKNGLVRKLVDAPKEIFQAYESLRRAEPDGNTLVSAIQAAGSVAWTGFNEIFERQINTIGIAYVELHELFNGVEYDIDISDTISCTPKSHTDYLNIGAEINSAAATLAFVLEPSVLTAIELEYHGKSTKLESNLAANKSTISSANAEAFATYDHTSQKGGERFRLTSQSIELRGILSEAGELNTFLAPNTDYTLELFNTRSNSVGTVIFTTGSSGNEFSIPNVALFSAEGYSDVDLDGVSDFAERVFGSNRSLRDTDGDGIDDLTEIKQGLEPLGGLGLPTGAIAASPVQGTADAVVTIAANDGSSRASALVATGAHGLAIVDTTQFTTPVVLSELDLPGYNGDVAAEAQRDLAAVAGGDAGLHVIDVSNPAIPLLLQSVPLTEGASRVEVRDGFAYVASGTNLAIVDLLTGEQRSLLNLSGVGGSTLTDIAIEGATLFSLDSSGMLRSISISGDVMSMRDSISLPAYGGRLFVGGGVAYIGAGNGGTGGYVTVNTEIPDDLRLLSGVDNNSVAGTSIVANGSGLAVGVGSSSFVFGAFRSLDVFSTSDPTNTGAFITRIDLPEVPRDVVLANGLAFVANGSAGLQIVNYIGFDNKGQAPQVGIAVDGVDVDAVTDGIQVREGRTLTIAPTITDDVQVRNVELLVNGQVLSNDVSFPFELLAQVPSIANGGDTVTVQVRATDTGGNVGLSNPITVDVVADTFAPRLLAASLDDGSARLAIRAATFTFDEPLDVTLLSRDEISLMEGGADGLLGTADDVRHNVELDVRSRNQTITVYANTPLGAGLYKLSVARGNLADTAGNQLAADLERSFTVYTIHPTNGQAADPSKPAANAGQWIAIPLPPGQSAAFVDFTTRTAYGYTGTERVRVEAGPSNDADASPRIAYVQVPLAAVTGEVRILFPAEIAPVEWVDGRFRLQVVPQVNGVELVGIAEGNATLLLIGSGFTEGAGTSYRIGTTLVTDDSVYADPDVTDYNNLTTGGFNTYRPNAFVRLTVPVTDGSFGTILTCNPPPVPRQ